jgi:hypothetical protein
MCSYSVVSSKHGVRDGKEDWKDENLGQLSEVDDGELKCGKSADPRLRVLIWQQQQQREDEDRRRLQLQREPRAPRPQHCRQESRSSDCHDKPPSTHSHLTTRRHAGPVLPLDPSGNPLELYLCHRPHLQAHAQREGVLLHTCRQAGRQSSLLLCCAKRWIVRQCVPNQCELSMGWKR